MDFDTALYSRKSCRAFEPAEIPSEAVSLIIDAGQQAPLPASYNKKTRIAVVSNAALLGEIRERLARDPMYGAPVVAFLSVEGISKDYIEYANIGCIIENMLLKATDLGIGSVYLWGMLHQLRREADLLEKLGVPSSHKLISAVAFGYPKQPIGRRESGQGILVDFI